MDCCRERYDISVPVYLLVILFGLGSWIAVNGIWVELPLLVPELPEGWALPSYLTVVIQLANIGPLLFFIGNTLKPQKIKEVPVVYVIVVVGAVSCFLLAFLWDKTTFVAGELHSTALLVITFFISIVDCTSSVVFLPFMARMKPQYMTAYYIGEGFSGLLPSLVSLGQGAGDYSCVNTSSAVNQSTNGSTGNWSFQPQYKTPAFPPLNFYLFTFGMMVVSGLAFTVINFVPHCKLEHVSSYQSGISEKQPKITFEKNYGFSANESDFSSRASVDFPEIGQSSESLPANLKHSTGMSAADYVFLLGLIFWSNALTNGVLVSMQTYSSLPYGPLAYSLANRLSQIANPLACFTAFFLPVRSNVVIGVMAFIASALGVYIMSLASLSPVPPFLPDEKDTGAALSVTAWVLATFFFSYVKVSIAELLRAEGRKQLLWCGGMTQVGSLCGSVTMFVLVLHGVFKDAPQC